MLARSSSSPRHGRTIPSPSGEGGRSLPPLCVDLDGSLLATDSLHESLLLAIARKPLALIPALPRLLDGRAAFKRAVAAVARPDPALLPYHDEILEHLREQRVSGRELALFSAADQAIVDSVASHLGLFDHAQGSDGVINLSGRQKLDAIRARYGNDFAYLGNDAVDLPIWEAARTGIVVGAHDLRQKAAGIVPLEASFENTRAGLRTWLRAVRLHQWAKNLLIFAPIVLAGPLAAPADMVKAAAGFFVFGLLASVGYVFNDLIDLDADRRHAEKRMRVFASGVLKPRNGLIAACSMLVFAAAAAPMLGSAFALVGLGYFAGTVSYSLRIKQIPILDVIVLAGLYTTRIVAGTTLTEAPFSYWIITFSMFMFLSLALVKRYAELLNKSIGDDAISASRGYSIVDLPLLLSFGAGSAVAAGLIFVVYLVDERFPLGIYSRPEVLWLIFPVLLLWLMNMWRVAVHGKMHEDPVLFALKDRTSLLLGAMAAAIVLLGR